MRVVVPIIFVVVVAFFIWWRYFSISRPKFAPLFIEPDDPLMVKAITEAKSSTPFFLELAGQANRGVRVKVLSVSNSGTSEFLWAEVLSVVGSLLELRYLTPPVTHSGRLDRLHTHCITDLVDWQVELESGEYAGGYTMRVLFIRGREQWGCLPPELEAEEKKYGQTRAS